MMPGEPRTAVDEASPGEDMGPDMFVRLCCFGSPRLFVNQQPGGTISSKSLALLVYLAHHPGEQTRQKLIRLLWENVEEKKALSSLRTALYHIAKEFGELLSVTRKAICFAPHVQLEVDTLRFLEATEGLSEPSQVVSGFSEEKHEALALFQGSFLDSFLLNDAPTFDDWIRDMREMLYERGTRLFRDCLQEATMFHRVELCLDYGKRLLRLDPWSEEAYRALMLAWGRAGRFSQAMRLYKECEQVLADELETPPSPETTATKQRVWQASQIAAPATPGPPGFFVGRESELQQAEDWLCSPECRALVVTGIGGVGKTSFAQQLFYRLRGSFLHGACWVPMQMLRSADELPVVILQALGIDVTGERQQLGGMLKQLRSWELLLCLDNAEHLLDQEQSLPWLDELLEAAPSVKVVITSRLQMRHGMLQHLSLGGLAFAEQAATERDGSFLQLDAPRLLIRAAQRQQPEYEPESDIDWLKQLCVQLQGLPLGLELAASFVLDPEAREKSTLSRSVEESPNVSDLLGSSSDVQALFEHSWERLSYRQKKLLGVLSLFVGGATFGALAELFQATGQELRLLVEHSLVQERDERWSLHPVVRGFVQTHFLEQSDAADAQMSYVDHYLTSLREHFSDPFTRQEALHSFASAEIANIREAWRLALEAERWELLAMSLAPLYKFFDEGCRIGVGIAWLKATLSEPPMESAPPTLMAHLNVSCAGLLLLMGKVEEAALFASRAATHLLAVEADVTEEGGPSPDAERSAIEAFLANTHGIIARRRCEYQDAEVAFQQALSLAQESLSPLWQIRPLINLGSTYTRNGKLDEAKDVLERARALCETYELFHGLAHTLNNLGMVALIHRDFPKAQEIFSECHEVAKRLGYVYVEAAAAENLSEVFLRTDQYTSCIELATSAAQRWRELHHEGAALRTSLAVLLALEALGRRDDCVEACVGALRQVEQHGVRSTVNALLCTFAQLLGPHGRPAMASALASFLLEQSATEEMYREKLLHVVGAQDEPQENSPSAHSELFPTQEQAWLVRLSSLYEAWAAGGEGSQD